MEKLLAVTGFLLVLVVCSTSARSIDEPSNIVRRAIGEWTDYVNPPEADLKEVPNDIESDGSGSYGSGSYGSGSYGSGSYGSGSYGSGSYGSGSYGSDDEDSRKEFEPSEESSNEYIPDEKEKPSNVIFN